MMNTKKRTLAVITTTAVLATGVGFTATALANTTPDSGTTPAASTTISDEVAKQLQLTREEERMARDLYAALAKAHDDARPMSMITNGEDHHYDAVGTLLTRYGVSDPSAGRAAGSYAYPELQKLYDQWLAKGKASVNAAYQVGVDLEKWDIAGLEKDVAASQGDVKQLYTNLLTASEHHLSAYEAAASGQPFSPGNGMGNGMGNQMGPGNGMGQGRHGGMHNGNGAGGPGQGFGGDCPMLDGDE